MAHVKETVLNFGPAGELVGILSRPGEAGDGPSKSADLAVVILNAGVLHRVGPNRMHVRLARSLAAQGTPCLRFDLPGIGDSRALGGKEGMLEENVIGMRAALDVLERRGVADRFLVFGLCSGADHAFILACVDPRVIGIAIVDPTRTFPTRKALLLKLLGPARRPEVWLRLITGRYRLFSKWRDSFRSGRAKGGLTSPSQELRRAREELSKLVERDVKICYLITGGRGEYRYREQLFDAFPEVDLRRTTRIEIFPNAAHTFPREADRLALEAVVGDWVDETARCQTGSSDEVGEAAELELDREAAPAGGEVRRPDPSASW